MVLLIEYLEIIFRRINWVYLKARAMGPPADMVQFSIRVELV
jgi:hypothetical protein